ncbi:DUF6588 family protein [Spirosoma gilvum]
MKTKWVLWLSVLSTSICQGQRIEGYLGTYTDNNARGYMQPLADALPAMFQSGWSQDARIDSGFHLYVGLVVFAALPMSAQRQFTATTQLPFTPEQSATVPTIFGDTRSVSVPGHSGTSYTFAGGLDTQYLPLAAPQLTLGNLFGTEISIRYFAFDFGRDFGRVDMVGGGIRHSLSQYLKRYTSIKNLDVALAYAEQEFKAGNVLKVHSRQLTLEAGQHGGHFAYYGFVGYLMGQTDIHYSYSSEATSRIDLSLANANAFVAGAGFSVKAWKLKLSANARYAGSLIATAGLGLDF